MYDQLTKKQDLIDIHMTLNAMMKLQRETTNLLIKHFETQSSRDTHPDPIRRETTDNTRETEILIERVSRISSGISNSSVYPNVSRVSKKESKSSSGSKGGGPSIYMMDVVDNKPTPTLIPSNSCMAIVVLLAIIWEELIPSWSSKIVFKILLYTVAALVYLHYARMATSERINIPESAC